VKKSYYAIIPANVRYDENLNPNAKLLYGEITALCNERGFCWAGNSYFAKLYNKDKSTVARWIRELEGNGYITREVIYKEGSREIESRYMRLCHEGIGRNAPTPIGKSERDSTTSLNTTLNTTRDSASISKVQEIYNHYLSKGIINHQKITSAIRTSVNARLRDYSYEQLIEAIDNYAVVHKSNKYWFDTKYTLADLMRDKDIRRFINDADPLNNFLKSEFKKGELNNDSRDYGDDVGEHGIKLYK